MLRMSLFQCTRFACLGRLCASSLRTIVGLGDHVNFFVRKAARCRCAITHIMFVAGRKPGNRQNKYENFFHGYGFKHLVRVNVMEKNIELYLLNEGLFVFLLLYLPRCLFSTCYRLWFKEDETYSGR